MLQDLRRDRIETAGGDGVAGKGRPGRGGGVVNRGGENAAALRGRGYGTESRKTSVKPCALPVGEEERLVLSDRPAHRKPVLIAPELGFRTRLGKVIPSVQVFVANEFKKRTVKIVRPPLADYHHSPAVRPSIF